MFLQKHLIIAIYLEYLLQVFYFFTEHVILASP